MDQPGDDPRKRAVVLGNYLQLVVGLVDLKRPASAAEIAEKVGQSTERVRYQLRQLADAGIVEAVDYKKRRGAVERFYLADGSMTVLEHHELDDVSPARRDRFFGQIFKVALNAAVSSFRAGLMGRRKGSFVLHIILHLDRQGWADLEPIYRKMWADVERVKTESALRLQSSEEEPIEATSALFLFERPPDE